MKLLLLQYINGMRERPELEALLPNLVTEMGMRVFSRANRGARQYGVDVAAVGTQDSGEEVVYLFSIKSGDLTRSEWQDGVQSLKPSLEEILEVYIPTHLPVDLRGKKIIVVMCFGGSVRQDVVLNVSAFETKHTSEKTSFDRWDGDKLVQLIEQYLLSEQLVPIEVRSHLRKAIALVEEPDACVRYFSTVIRYFVESKYTKPKEISTALKKLSVCVWVIVVWSRESKNLESSMRITEGALLNAWHLIKADAKDDEISQAWESILSAYLTVYKEYTEKVAISADIFCGLSVAVRSSHPVDVNLAMFKLIGRVSLFGIWLQAAAPKGPDGLPDRQIGRPICELIRRVILNNPTLNTPIKDDHVVEIGLLCFFMSFYEEFREFLHSYLSNIADSSLLAMEANGPFPCILQDYSELIRHPQSRETDYIHRCTASSVLYPTLAVWGVVVGKDEIYLSIRSAKENQLSHCSFQIWSPNKDTEAHLYLNDSLHGTSYLGLSMGENPDNFLQDVWSECEAEPSFNDLSCIKYGYYPVLLTACRRYRLALPFHLVKEIYLLHKASRDADLRKTTVGG